MVRTLKILMDEYPETHAHRRFFWLNWQAEKGACQVEECSCGAVRDPDTGEWISREKLEEKFPRESSVVG